MIRVTIELLPGGLEKGKKHLGTMEISNDLSGTPEVGNYNVRLSKWGRPTHTWKKGRVEGFYRLKRGPYDLMYLALKNIVGYRNREKGEKAGGV